MREIARVTLATFLLGTAACGGGGGQDASELSTSSVALRARRTIQLERIREEGVNALFSSTNGCVETDAQIIAFTQADRILPAPATHGGAVAVVFAHAFDVCLQAPIVDGVAIVDDPAGLTITPDLSRATLDATIEGLNETYGTNITYTISMSWSATGPREVERFRSVDESIPGVVVRFQERDVNRPATATGTLSDGQIDYASAPSIEGGIQLIRQGIMTVTRTN